MKKVFQIVIIVAVFLSINSCDNKKDQEKELLKTEVELLKKEKEVLEKTKATTQLKSDEKVTRKSSNVAIQKNKKETPENKPDINYILGVNKAGQFIKGEKAPTELPSRYTIDKKSRLLEEEGNTWEEIYFQVSENGNELLSYKMGEDYNTKKNNVITGILVTSTKYKTSSNIGIGSTVEDFIKAYPNYSLWYTYIGDMFVIQDKSMKVQFLLDHKDYIGNKENLDFSDMVIVKTSDFKLNSKITSIRIY